MLGSALIWAMPLAAVAAPVLSSMNYDVLAAAGGAGVVAAGANLSGADQARLSPDGTTWTSATVTASTSTTVTITTPALTPGVYQLQVHTAGGWSASLTVYVESSPLLWLGADRATVVSSKVTGIPNTVQGGSTTLAVAQATSAAQPGYTAARPALGNQPAVTFTGSPATYLKSGALGTAINGPLTVYAVFDQTLFGGRFLTDSVTGTERICLFDGGDGSSEQFFSNGYLMTGGINSSGVGNVWTIIFNTSGQASQVYQNDMSTPVHSGNDIAIVSFTSLVFGARYTLEDTASFAGACGTLAFFAGVHDATTRTRIGARLKAKYGIT